MTSVIAGGVLVLLAASLSRTYTVRESLVGPFIVGTLVLVAVVLVATGMTTG
jgi:hypothetical protein